MTATPESLEIALQHAVTEYDRKQAGKRCWNPHALPLYLEAVERAVALVRAGKDVRSAIVANFNDRLLDRCLKAAGLSKSELAEQYESFR